MSTQLQETKEKPKKLLLVFFLIPPGKGFPGDVGAWQLLAQLHLGLVFRVPRHGVLKGADHPHH